MAGTTAITIGRSHESRAGVARARRSAAASRCRKQTESLRTLMIRRPLSALQAAMTSEERRACAAQRERMRQLNMTDTELMRLYHGMKRERQKR